MVLSIVLTACYTRVVMGLVVDKTIRHHEALLLDHLNEGTNGLVIYGRTDAKVGTIGWTYHL